MPYLNDFQAAAKGRSMSEDKHRSASRGFKLLLEPGQLLAIDEDLVNTVSVATKSHSGKAQAKSGAKLCSPVVPLSKNLQAGNCWFSHRHAEV